MHHRIVEPGPEPGRFEEIAAAAQRFAPAAQRTGFRAQHPAAGWPSGSGGGSAVVVR